MDTVASISLSALRSLVGTPRAPFVVDVRKPPAFDADPLMIASAVRRAHDAVAEWAGALPAGREVVVYCAHGHEVSQGAARALVALGVPARYLEGGIEDWKAASAPTIRKLADIGHGSIAATRWVTRERPKIDRVACPWLIRRFVDPLAAFDYVAPERVLDAARVNGAIPYDVPNVRFSHRGERCSFDAMLEDFALREPALDALAVIVRGADTAHLDLAPQAAGLLAVSLGLSRVHADDAAMLEAAMPVYDALYAWCRAQVSHGRGEPHRNYPS
jgi:rhodanese-related sulfurtransferase